MQKVNIDIIVAVCVFMMALAVPAAADTHYVTQGASIQAVIDDAKDYDEIEVEPGTYNEAIDFKGKAIRLYSSGGPDVTTINGTGAYHVVQCVSGENANTVLEGFAITGGDADGASYPDDSGAGMLNDRSSPTIINCIFNDNSADGAGAGMCNTQSSPAVTNCTFMRNTTYNGGGMFNDNSSPTITNCTFSDNSVSRFGGGMCNINSSNPVVNNCILWGDSPDEIYDDGKSSSTVSYSDVQGGWGGAGSKNIDSDPLFVDASHGNFRLSPGSLCIEKGDSNALPADRTDMDDDYDTTEPIPFDLDYNPRIMGYRVDTGAYEWQRIIYVDDDRPADFSSIQAAIDAAVSGVDQVEVKPGTYIESINFNGKAIRLYSSDGHEVTTIDANGAYHVVQCVSGEDPNTVLEGFTITGGYADVIAGYDNHGGGMLNLNSSPTVTDCNFVGNVAGTNGGGMYNEDSNLVVTNCTFNGNVVWSFYGGGMCSMNSSPTVTNCTFIGNQSLSGNHGGGMHNLASSTTVTDCNFIGNTAHMGGGMCSSYGSTTVTNCNFISNTADLGGGVYSRFGSMTMTSCSFISNSADGDYGGGMVSFDSNSTVAYCTFSLNTANKYGGGIYSRENNFSMVIYCTFDDNTSNENGGGIYNWGEGIYVVNCVFSGNTADANGGGMYSTENSQARVVQCTFAGNSATNGSAIACDSVDQSYPSTVEVINSILWDDTNEVWNNDGSGITINYSDVQGGWAGPGTNNINADPCFVDATGGDLHLSAHSPAIDTGDTTVHGTIIDFDGNSRAVDDPFSPDTGRSSLLGLTVDMGAYEFQSCRIAGDSNCDGVVDFRDLAILCGNWLAGTEPEL